MIYPTQSITPQPPPDPTPPTFRSGAVARMAGMPVSTLRVWEQRYQAVGPTTAPSGHRLYSLADVERVVALRQLTQHGHAIGSLAPLNIEQLQDLNQTLASADTAQPQPRHAPFRLVVVGQAMVQRLQRPSVFDRWAQPPQIVAVFDSLDEASQAAVASNGTPVDLLLWGASSLQDDAVARLKAARAAWRAHDMAVAYRFAVPTARDALLSAGASVVREPADDGALAAWLSTFEALPLAVGDAHRETGADHRLFDALALGAGALPASRFDDTALTKFAGLLSSVACECPGHVAELLMQITSFESYSASCANRNLADTELHHYLQRVAGTARLLFEAALERVAIAEGLALPCSGGPTTPGLPL